MLPLHGQDTTAVNQMSISGHAINIRNIILEILFPLRSGIRQGYLLSPPFQYSFGSPSHGNQRRKRIQIGKEVVKLSLLADDIYYTWKVINMTPKTF